MLQLILQLFNVIIHKGFVGCERDVLCWIDSIMKITVEMYSEKKNDANEFDTSLLANK